MRISGRPATAVSTTLSEPTSASRPSTISTTPLQHRGTPALGRSSFARAEMGYNSLLRSTVRRSSILLLPNDFRDHRDLPPRCNVAADLDLQINHSRSPELFRAKQLASSIDALNANSVCSSEPRILADIGIAE